MNNNPYNVLGISQSAGEEEVKKAYRALARQYHSENYAQKPLSDIAQEKMNEINRAYDYVMANVRNSDERDNESGDFKNKSSQYPDVISRIKNGHVDDAITLLDGIPVAVRTAEWYYLKGMAQHRRGWIEEAYRNYKVAADMDPGNSEYHDAIDELNSVHKRFEYKNAENRYSSSDDICKVCLGLICLDSCCGCGDDCF
ncbi:MAG: DnaJ domain-containing protein [Clostridiales bacterium]|jgi:curved DNA-binding protein CbpA|nr:DnaJ domain-containing protein [Clostridiales bacterium]